MGQRDTASCSLLSEQAANPRFKATILKVIGVMHQGEGPWGWRGWFAAVELGADDGFRDSRCLDGFSSRVPPREPFQRPQLGTDSLRKTRSGPSPLEQTVPFLRRPPHPVPSAARQQLPVPGTRNTRVRVRAWPRVPRSQPIYGRYAPTASECAPESTAGTLGAHVR